MNNPIVPVGGNQMPTTPQDLAEYYRKVAEAYAAEERSGGSNISIRNGVMSVGDQPIPGNQMASIILDAVHLNTWYPDAYNPQQPLPPRCYAIGRSDAEMRPHPDMAKAPQFFAAQSESCLSCPLNQWGSGPNGKGKACRNRRRIIMLPAGTYQGGVLQPILDPAYYGEAALHTLDIPPTNLGGWGEYVRGIAAQWARPFSAIVTRVYVYPHPKHGKETVGFEAIGPMPDDWAPTIFRRVNEAAAEIFRGYEAPDMSAPTQAPAPQAGGGFYQQQQQAPGWPQQGQG